METGIIYKYTSPSGKVYIGQTIHQKQRRNSFLNINRSYGGIKIDRARLKYGVESFDYKILCNVEANSKQELGFILNRLEKMYIKKYDSLYNGYNCNIGGGSAKGYKHTDEQRTKISDALKGRCFTDEHKANLKKSFIGKTLSNETKKKMSDARKGRRYVMSDYQKECISKSKQGVDNPKKYKPVLQYDLLGNIINKYDSLKEAALKLNVDYTNISKCLNGRRKTAFGFVWKFDF